MIKNKKKQKEYEKYVEKQNKILRESIDRYIMRVTNKYFELSE